MTDKIPSEYPENTQPADKDSAAHIHKAESILSSAGRGLASMAKTHLLRKDRVTPEQYNQRLDVCRACPGNHATFKNNGSLHTCGPMLKSMADSGQKTCGCILKRKAWDAKESCPFGYWPTIDSKHIDIPESSCHENQCSSKPSKLHVPNKMILRPDTNIFTPPIRDDRPRIYPAPASSKWILDPKQTERRVIDPSTERSDYRNLVTRRSFVRGTIAAISTFPFAGVAFAAGLDDWYVPVEPCMQWANFGFRYFVKCSDLNGHLPGDVFYDSVCQKYFKVENASQKEIRIDNAKILTPSSWVGTECYCPRYVSCSEYPPGSGQYLSRPDCWAYKTRTTPRGECPEEYATYIRTFPLYYYKGPCMYFIGHQPAGDYAGIEDDFLFYFSKPIEDCSDPRCPENPDSPPGTCQTLTSCSTDSKIQIAAGMTGGSVISWNDDCWIVSGEYPCELSVTRTISGYSTVSGCSASVCDDDGYCYTLTHCDTGSTIETDSNLKAYENSVVLYNEACWIVSSAHACVGTTQTVSGLKEVSGCDDVAAGCEGNCHICWTAASCDSPTSFALLEGDLSKGDVVLLSGIEGARCYVVEDRIYCPAGGDTNWTPVSSCEDEACPTACDLCQVEEQDPITVSVSGQEAGYCDSCTLFSGELEYQGYVGSPYAGWGSCYWVWQAQAPLCYDYHEVVIVYNAEDDEWAALVTVCCDEDPPNDSDWIECSWGVANIISGIECNSSTGKLSGQATVSNEYTQGTATIQIQQS